MKAPSQIFGHLWAKILALHVDFSKQAFYRIYALSHGRRIRVEGIVALKVSYVGKSIVHVAGYAKK
jgi:hypothetical protein